MFFHLTRRMVCVDTPRTGQTSFYRISELFPHFRGVHLLLLMESLRMHIPIGNPNLELIGDQRAMNPVTWENLYANSLSRLGFLHSTIKTSLSSI